jgi:integrase
MSKSEQFWPTLDGYRDKNIGSLRKSKASGTWKIVHRSGKESLHTTDENEARAQFDKRRGKPRLYNGDINLEQAAAMFLERPGRETATREAYKTSIEHYLLPRYRKERPRDVTPEMIENAFKLIIRNGGVSGKPLSDTTIENIESAWSSFFSYCMSVPLRCSDHNPVTLARASLDDLLNQRRIDSHKGMEEVDDEQEVDKVVTPEEVQLLAAEVGRPRRNRADAIVFAYQMETLCKIAPELGARPSEFLGAKVSDYRRLSRTPTFLFARQRHRRVKAQDPSTWVKKLKSENVNTGKKKREVGVSAYAQEVLNAYVDRGMAEKWLEKDGLLFPSAKGTPLSMSAVLERFRESSDKVLGRRVTPHFFRHTFASRQYAAGQDVRKIAKAMGDTVLVVMTTYLHLIDSEEDYAATAHAAAVGRR